MSLLIKGMDMPKNGEITIAFASDENGENTLALILDTNGKPIEHKGVVEIHTPHGRLIDADDIDSIAVAFHPNDGDPFVGGRLRKIIAPIIIEAEE